MIGSYNSDMSAADRDVIMFRALAHPVRLGMMRQLVARPETCACDFTDVFAVSQPTVSQHLKVLREVGLVAVRDVGRQRVYSLNGQPLKPIHDWVKAYEASWSRRFDLLDEVLQELKDEDKED